ncbi:hypothetical protein [Flammeovirga sp. SJP92]|uniref:hypothetical protein n=1 Tax=Flammeovirga sp. SJP92 TaxID=1775430 RepID=UPI000789A36C|nr:hypothetical protein [Flammeovirga sp. SJP92]KXX71303.1 hypothetical protein AVL50_06765 [Flammeovirga sp. SJP92]
MRNIIRYIFLIGIICLSCSENHRIDFDSEIWKNWVETESTMSLRWDMRKDLLKKHKLINLNEREIIELLGEPEQRYSNTYQYNLGVARHGIDYGTLTIEFENEKVIDFKISRG